MAAKHSFPCNKAVASSAAAIRHQLVSSQYRNELNFTLAGLEASARAVQRLVDFRDRLREVATADDAEATALPRQLPPGTRVHVTIRLRHGTCVALEGRIAWSRETIHPALFGAPRGCCDDAEFGIAFEETPVERLLPIARLFAARDGERRRARRIRRLHGLPIHA